MSIDEMIEALDKIRKSVEDEDTQYQLSCIGLFLSKLKEIVH